MADVVAELSLEPPLTAERLDALAARGGRRCLALHGVRLKACVRGSRGSAAVCHFDAPDAESVRIGLRQAGIAFDRVWRAAVREPSEGVRLLISLDGRRAVAIYRLRRSAAATKADACAGSEPR